MKNIKIILIIGLFILTGCGKKEDEAVIIDNAVSNTNEGIYEMKEKDGVTYQITSFVIRNKEDTTVIGTIENKTETEYTLKPFLMLFKDKDGNIIAAEKAIEESVIIAKDDFYSLQVIVNADLSKVTNIEYQELSE